MPVEAATHPGRLTPCLLAALDLVDALAPAHDPRRPRLCSGCGRDIPTGHTLFILYTSSPFTHVTCYECGEAIALHLGWLTPAELPWCRPHLGGRLLT